MRTKLADVYKWILCCSCDIVAISESWLHPCIGDDEFCSRSFCVYRQDRASSRPRDSLGGGVLLLVSNRFLSCRLDLSQLTAAVPLIDVVGVKLMGSDAFKCYVFVIYVPPSVSFVDFSVFFELFSSLQYLNEGVTSVLVGDFNVPSFCATGSTRENVTLNNFSGFHNMSQCNSVANNVGRLLDLVFCNSVCTVGGCADPIVSEDLYHPTLEVSLSIATDRRHRFSPDDQMHSYNFKRADFPLLYDLFQSADWSFVEEFDDVDQACDEFYRILYQIIDVAVPKTSTGSGKRYPVWVNSEVRAALRRKNNMHRKYKQTKVLHYWCEFRRYRSLSKQLMNAAYRDYMTLSQQSLRDDPKRFWSFIHEKKGNTRIPGLIRDDTAE